MSRHAVQIIVYAMLFPLSVAAQDRATGPVTIEQPPPEPRGAIVTTPDGRSVEVPRGGAFQVQGANVVVEKETPRGTTLTVQNDVLFDFDKAELKPEATEALGRVVEIIRQRKPRAALVVGHTDSVGADAYNDQLSRRRAEAVRDWIASHGGDRLPAQRRGQGGAGAGGAEQRRRARRPRRPATEPPGRGAAGAVALPSPWPAEAAAMRPILALLLATCAARAPAFAQDPPSCTAGRAGMVACLGEKPLRMPLGAGRHVGRPAARPSLGLRRALAGLRHRSGWPAGGRAAPDLCDAVAALPRGYAAKLRGRSPA
ncbi:OmpA family protein [Dankookia sp. P2]|uniref:OmpA family protein n=1 Tax=Dankookia sp. P2 TaxID=3423955 RepID=UPI003D66742C